MKVLDGEYITDEHRKATTFSVMERWKNVRFKRTIKELNQFDNKKPEELEAMFTLYRIVKRSDAESVSDRASVHTRNASFEAVSAPEQYCTAPLLKVERSVSDRFLKQSESSLNTCIGAEIATEPRFVNDLFKSIHTGNASEQFLHHK